MVVGACIPIFLWLPHGDRVTAFLSALLVLLIFGAWDDRRELDYRLKFLGQFLAVLLIVFWGEVTISVFPFAGMDPVPAWLSIPVTVVFLVGVTNAVNLSDGLDGLAAGVTLLSLGTIAFLANLANGDEIMVTCFIIAGAIFGFLRYNTYPARIFMGDTGSQFLGFTVGVLSIALTQQVNTALNPWLPLFLVGLPMVDTLFVMAKRISEGRSPFAADRTHMHHRLLSMGLAHYEAVSVIYITQAAFLLTAVLLRYHGDLVVILAYFALVGLSLGTILLLQPRRGWPGLKWGRLTRHVVRLDGSDTIQRWSLRIMQCGVAIYLVSGTLMLTRVPVDISVSALIILPILLVRLRWASRLRVLSLRLLIFPTIAFAVYLMHREQAVTELMPPALRIGLLVVMLVLMLLVIRTTKDQTFQTTPTDLLVIALAGGVGVLYQQGMIEVSQVPVVLSIVVLFYVAELIMRHMKRIWNCFTVGIVAVLVLLSLQFF